MAVRPVDESTVQAASSSTRDKASQLKLPSRRSSCYLLKMRSDWPVDYTKHGKVTVTLLQGRCTSFTFCLAFPFGEEGVQPNITYKLKPELFLRESGFEEFFKRANRTDEARCIPNSRIFSVVNLCFAMILFFSSNVGRRGAFKSGSETKKERWALRCFLSFESTASLKSEGWSQTCRHVQRAQCNSCRRESAPCRDLGKSLGAGRFLRDRGPPLGGGRGWRGCFRGRQAAEKI